MKKILICAAVTLTIIMILPVAAFALNADITPKTADTTLTVYNAGGQELSSGGTYSNPAYYEVIYENSAIKAGNEYVIMVVSGTESNYTIDENSLIYIDQVTSTEGRVKYARVYPERLTDSVIIISGSDVKSKVIATIDAQAGLLGDVDFDNDVTAFDAQRVLRASVGLITFTPEEHAVGDVDFDGDISAFDAQRILRYSVGLITEFK